MHHHHHHVNINGIPGTTAYLHQNGNPTINEHFPRCVTTTYSHSTTTINNVVVGRHRDIPGCSKSADNSDKIGAISEERCDSIYSENQSTGKNGWPSIISVLDTPERKRLRKSRFQRQGSIDENSLSTWALGSPPFSQTPEIIGSPPVLKTPKTMLSNVTNTAPNVHISPMGSFNYRSCLKDSSPRSSFSKQFYGFSFSGSNLRGRRNEIQQQQHLNALPPLQPSKQIDSLKPVSRVLELAPLSTSTPCNPSHSHSRIDILSSLVKLGGSIDSFHRAKTANNSSYDSGCFVTSSSLTYNTSFPSRSGTKNCVETPSKGLNVSLSIEHDEVDSSAMNANRFLQHSTLLGNHVDDEYVFTPKNFGLDDSVLDLDDDELSLSNPFVDDVIRRMKRRTSPDLPVLHIPPSSQVPPSSQGKRTSFANNSTIKHRQRLEDELFGLLDRRAAIGETEDQLSVIRMAKAFRRRHKLGNRPAFAPTNLRSISAGLPSDALADGVIIHL